MNELNGLKIDLARLYDIAQELLNKYKQRLLQIDAKSSGNLINTADYNIQLKDTTITLSFDLANYWYQIEHKRGPNKGEEHWPDPIGDITRWLQIKIQSGKFMPLPGHTLPTTQKEMKHTAWLIVNKISNEGYKREGEKAEPLQRTIDENMKLFEEFAGVVADQIGADVVAEFMTLNTYAGKTYTKKIKMSPGKTR